MSTNFKEFALNPALHASLEAMKFETPTPIQALAIPFALEGRDILGSAQTGTGKTAAFCVPMINFLMNNPTAHALVMLPTRELAAQVHVVARQMIGNEAKGQQGIKTALLIGGEPIGKQYAQLDRRPRLIVGTPGRINDHLRSNPDLVDRVAFVVLDEADRMLDMGFAPQIDSILSETALERQTLMFSATFPDNMVRFTKQYLNNPERVSAGVQSKPGENIVQESMHVAQERKYDELMLQLHKREGSVIVFVRTQHGADKLSAKLNKDEHTAEAIHGGLRQRQRDKVIQLFRKSAVRILVATDVAARGLDVPHIEHVINFDLPQVAEDYIHRIGRTARGGAKGQAVSFISPGEKHLWRDIERMLDPSAANSDVREGGRGPSKGKKFGGGKSFGKKPFEKRSEGFGGERNYGPKKEGGFKKPFAKKPQWNPDGDFRGNSESNTEGSFDSRPRRNFDRNDRPQRSEGGENRAPRREYNNDRPQRSEGYQGNRDGGFKKPYQKREDGFASNPDSYKRTNSAERKEGGYKKPFNRDGAQSDRPRSNWSDRPQRSEGNGYQGNREGGFKKPYNRDGAAPRTEGGYKKPFNRDGAQSDRPRSNWSDRPQRAEGDRKEGGFKKPFKKDGDRPFVKREGGSAQGAKKPYVSKDGGAKRAEGRTFRKDGGARSEGHAQRSAKKRAY
jgi:superfamily II DNA/RNA helicase